MATLATIVDWAALGRTVIASLVAGTGLALVFSLALMGFVRSHEAGGEGRHLGTFGFGLLAAVGLLLSVSLAAAGIFVMIRG